MSWFTLMSTNCSCISDTAGNLLFATNGEWIVNANNDTMPNGYLSGNLNSAQSVIVPRPEHPGNYYIFTTEKYYWQTGFRYTEVNMALDTGLGDVVPGQVDVLLQNSCTDRVTSVKHANGTDIWVITHQNNTNAFKAYLVTKNGVNPIPVTSNSGTIIQETPPYEIFDAACNGNIKASPCGRRIAISSKGLNLVEVFDFDSETGVISNPISLTMQYPFFLEFSGDGNMLYCGGEWGWLESDTTKLYQVNLIESNNQAIVNSLYHLNDFQYYPPQFGRIPIQLAPNDKIYVGYMHTNNTPPHIGVINSPHLSDTSCNFVHDELMLPYPSYYGTQLNGFPNFMTSFLDKNIFATNECFGDTTMFYTLNSYLFDSIRWEITDPLTGLHIHHNQDTIYHLYSQPGKYTIHCVRYRGTYIDDFEKKVQVLPYALSTVKDTTLCTGEQVQLTFTGNLGNVNWYYQSNSSSSFQLLDSGQAIMVNQEGYYYPEHEYWNVCGDQVDTAYITIININLDISPDTLSGNCITDPYFINPWINVSDVEYYQWNTGSYNFAFHPDTSGLYILYASGYGCEEKDSVLVIYDEPLQVDIGQDLQLCDDSASLSINIASEEYFWYPGTENTQSIFASESGEYIGMAINGCGAFADTVIVQIGTSPPEDISEDATLCFNDSILTDPPILEANYLWSTGDSLPEIYLSDPGIYTLTISNFCDTSEYELELFIDSILYPNLPDTIWLNESDSVFVEAGVTAESFFWSNGSTEPFTWIPDSGYYYLSVTNACGGFTDSVYGMYTLNILESEWSEKISIYPNPTQSWLTIDGLNKQDEIILFDRLGRHIMSGYTKDQQYKLDISDQPQGVIIIRIRRGYNDYYFKVIKD